MTEQCESSTSDSLLAGLRHADPAAWERISTIYGPLILHWCSGLGMSANDAEDVCQNVLTNVMRYGHLFRKERPSDRFRGWLYRVTRNEVLRNQNDPHRLRPFSPEDMEYVIHLATGQTCDEPDDPETVLWELTQRAMGVLQSTCQHQTWEIFIQAIAEGANFELVGERFGTTATNVRQIKFRMLAKLRDLLELTDDAGSS